MKVLLVRDVRCPQLEGKHKTYYAAWHEFPIMPFKGLLVSPHYGLDPEPIEWIFVNRDNDIVCVLESDVFAPEDLISESGTDTDLEKSWSSQKKFLLSAFGEEWVKVGCLPCYASPPRSNNGKPKKPRKPTRKGKQDGK